MGHVQTLFEWRGRLGETGKWEAQSENVTKELLSPFQNRISFFLWESLELEPINLGAVLIKLSNQHDKRSESGMDEKVYSQFLFPWIASGPIAQFDKRCRCALRLYFEDGTKLLAFPPKIPIVLWRTDKVIFYKLACSFLQNRCSFKIRCSKS